MPKKFKKDCAKEDFKYLFLEYVQYFWSDFLINQHWPTETRYTVESIVPIIERIGDPKLTILVLDPRNIKQIYDFYEMYKQITWVNFDLSVGQKLDVSYESTPI